MDDDFGFGLFGAMLFIAGLFGGCSVNKPVYIEDASRAYELCIPNEGLDNLSTDTSEFYAVCNNGVSIEFKGVKRGD